jgi:hypothetical protein
VSRTLVQTGGDVGELKTTETVARVDAFLAALDPERRRECERVRLMMKEATGAEPRMWGRSIVGFGRFHYRDSSGRECTWFLTGFSPRTNDLMLYIMAPLDRYEDLLARLGRYRTWLSCLLVERLSDVDEAALRELITAAVAHMKSTYSVH